LSWRSICISTIVSLPSFGWSHGKVLFNKFYLKHQYNWPGSNTQEIMNGKPGKANVIW
jgi:hypothetical protein